jgi:uncharacterized protein YbbK (DUF523 family)
VIDLHLISACLCGIDCKYSGENNYNDEVFSIFSKGQGILVCPEQLGGLATPRKPCEIVGGSGEEVLQGTARVLNSEGVDLTKEFIKGAEETLKIAKAIDCKKVILKANSPSCGFGKIYSGNFNGELIEGEGVTAALLRKNGIIVESDEKYIK